MIIPHVIKISYPYQKVTLGYLYSHFLRKNHALKWTLITLLYTNNNIIVQTQKSNKQNKIPTSIINNSYPQINWSCYSSLDKLMRAISWIKMFKSNWVKWKTGEQTREDLNIITAVEFQDSQHELTHVSQNTSFKEEINNF